MTKYISKERKGLLYIIAIAVMIALMCMACKKRVTQPASFSLEDTYIENETTTPSPTPDPEPTPEPENPNPPVVEPENPNPPTVEPEPTPKPEPPVVEPEPTPKPEPTPEPEPAPKPVLAIDKSKGLSQFIGKSFKEEKARPFEDYSGYYNRTVKVEKTGNGVIRLVFNTYMGGVKKNYASIYFNERGTPTDMGNGKYSFPVYQNDNHKGKVNWYGSGNTTAIISEDGSLQINMIGFIEDYKTLIYTLE